MKLTPAKILYIILRSWRIVSSFVLLGAGISSIYLATAYRYVSVQRIMIESQSTSTLQAMTAGQTSRFGGWNDGERDAELAIRKLNTPAYYGRIADKLKSEDYILRALAIPKTQVILQRLGLSHFNSNEVVPVDPSSAAGIIAGTMFLRVDENDSVEIRVTHASPFVSSAIANAAAVVGREFIMAASLAEITEASRYVEQETAALSQKIEEVDKQTSLLSAGSSDGDVLKSMTFDQSKLTQEILNAELEIETNNKILEKLRSGHDKRVVASKSDLGSLRSSISDTVLLKVGDLRQIYERISILQSQGSGTDSFELAELKDSAQALEVQLENVGIRLDSIRTLSSESNDFSSIFELERRNSYLKTFMEVSTAILKGRLAGSTHVQELALKREGLGRYRQLLYRNLENLSAQLFDFKLRKISINNKYSIGELLPSGKGIRTPSISGVLMFCVTSSFGLAIFIVMVLHARNPIILDFSDLQLFGLKKIGELPMLRRSRKSRRKDSRSTLVASIEILNEFKAIANRITRLHPRQGGALVLGVSSTAAAEGKSFVAFKLAQTIGRLNGRTLLCDCDVLAPRLKEYLAEDHSASKTREFGGVFAVHKISEELDIAFLLPDTNYDHLIAFFSGSPDYMKMKDQYQSILLDLPPIALVPDSVPLLRSLSMITYVVRSGRNRSSAIAHVLADIDEYKELKTYVILNCVRSFFREDYGESFLYGYGKGDKANKEYLVAPHNRRPAA